MTNKTESEIDRANRMFAIEQAVKLGVREGVSPVEHARDFHAFLSEAGPVESYPVGFSSDEAPEAGDAAKYL